MQRGQEEGVDPDLAIVVTEDGHVVTRPGGQQLEQSVRVTRGPGAGGDHSHLKTKKGVTWFICKHCLNSKHVMSQTKELKS